MATNVVVKAYHADPNAGLSYPNDWEAMTTTQLSAPDVPANSAAEIVVGPFAWVPRHVGHECMLMIVSATGDESNVDHIAAGDSIPDWRLIPHDNNIGQRNVAPVPGGGTTGLADAFADRTFELKNPMATTSKMELRAQLPEVLASRNWRMEFASRGGAAFPLEPGQSRTVVLRLVRGAEFTAQDIRSAVDRTIHITARADGILVGGMSYQLDPDLRHTGNPDGHDAGCDLRAESLVKCIDFGKEKVRSVAVRRVTLDLEFEGPCD